MENNAFNIYPGDNIPPKINALHNIFGNTYGNFFNANEIMENGEYTRTYNSQYLPADLAVHIVRNEFHNEDEEMPFHSADSTVIMDMEHVDPNILDIVYAQNNQFVQNDIRTY